MVELNRSPFRKKSASNPFSDNMGTIVTAVVIMLCIFASIRMQQGPPEQRVSAADGVVLEMAPSRSEGVARRGADPLPPARSSLEVRPIWGEVRGLEKPAAPVEDEPEPEPEPPPPEPEAPAFAAPDFSDLMKGVQAQTETRMKKAEFGATTKGGSSASGGGGFQRVTSFEEKERVEREAREKERQAAGPPLGGYDNPEAAAALQRIKQAIERGGAPEAMQKFGLDLPKLYQLQAGGHDLQQYLSPEGTFNISDQDAAAMAGNLGLANLGPDKKTTDSVIRPGR